MTTAIDAVKAELETARHALQGAQESYAEARQKADEALKRAGRAYEGRARNARNVDRLEKALALLEEDDQ